MNILCDIHAHAAAEHIFLHRDDELMIFAQMIDHIGVEWLHKPRIYQGTCMSFCLQFFPDMLSGAHHASESKKSNVRLLIEHLRLSVLDRRPELLQSAVRLTSRIADRERCVELHAELQHVLKLPEILRRHDVHPRNKTQKRNIKDSLVGLPVASHKTGPVDRE